MDLLPVTAVLGVVLVGVAVVLVVVLAAERARVRRIEKWARENDWYVVHRPDVGWCARVPGRNRWGASLQVRGTAHGYPVSVTEYSYATTSTTSDGRGGMQSSTVTHHFVVTVVRLAAVHAPVAVLPRGAVSRLGLALFGEPPTAVGHPEFDRLFRVRTDRPGFARALLGRALIAEHLAGRVPFWDLAGHDLLTWQPGRIDDPRSVPARADALVRVALLLGR